MDEAASMANSHTSKDPFDDILSLEDQYFNEGYDLGVADGSRAGRIEGRVFGLQKGFDKFVEMGRLNGRAAVWDARLLDSSRGHSGDVEAAAMSGLHATDRLKKHVHRLKALTDRDTLSTENNEEAVSEFDDRLKDATAKATLIAKIANEDDGPDPLDVVDSSRPARAPTNALRVRKNKGGTKSGEMEDFQGVPGSKR